MEDITKLARDFQQKLFMGRHKMGDKYKDQKEVNCNMCKRPMTVRDFEAAPYYCYKCCEELECALR